MSTQAHERAERVLAEMRERDAQVLADMPAIPPCPSWCGDVPGHLYDTSVDDARLYVRCHDTNGRGIAGVTQVERNRDGQITLEPAVVSLYDSGTLDLTPSQARALAAELVEGADLVARIEVDRG